VIVYDWALTFGQEFELVLSKRWSFMTILYICVRCIGLLFSVISILWNFPTISVTDVGCIILWYIQAWIPIVINVVLGVIMIARINAMYRGSKKLLIFLVIALLACTINSVVLMVIGSRGVSTQEAVLSGYHICIIEFDTYTINLNYESVIPTTVWEIFAFFLAVWNVIRLVRELRRSPTSTIGEYLRILIKSHAFYFLAFAAVACFSLGALSPSITNSPSAGSAVYSGVWSIADALQMFILGSRLILSIRGFHAKVMASTDEGIGMASIAFRATGDALTIGDA
jgi:hypothetical protein